MTGIAARDDSTFIRYSFRLSLAVHVFESLVDQCLDLIDSDAHVSCVRKQSVDALTKNSVPLSPGKRRGRIRDECADRATLEHDAGVFQLTIGARHGVRVDQKLLGQSTNGRQLFRGRQYARGHQIFDLVEDLLVHRQSIVR